MSNNRRNSSVLCNGVSAMRLENWRRSFRQKKRTSMLDINTQHNQAIPNPNEMMGHQKFLFPLSEPNCSFEYSNQTVNIGNRYEFVDSEPNSLGHGAYGDVFKGKAYELGREKFRSVAIKRMAEINVKSNELEAMKRVQNPFLVSLIDICRDENNLHTYIIMELCDIDLDKYLKFHTPDGFLSKSEYNLVMQHVAFGYHSLFVENIVHRDLKPQNILLLLSPNGNGIQIVKLTDFGICRVLEDADGKLSNIAGTFHYMSPEIGANILKTSEYNCEADMWSIGCVLFQCLTGLLPFDEQELCKLFLHCACSNFYDVAPELPPETSEQDVDLIKKLLEMDRFKRLTPYQFYKRAIASMKSEDGSFN